MDKVLINSVVALLFLVHMSQVMCAQNSEDDAALVAVETEDADKEIPGKPRLVFRHKQYKYQI